MYDERPEILYEKVFKNKEVFLNGMCEYKGDIYGVSANESVILRLETKTGTIHYFARIPESKSYLSQSYFYMQIIHNIMYLIPFKEKNLITCNMHTREFKIYHLEPYYIHRKNMPNFYNFCLYKNIIYLFPVSSSNVVAYDFITGKSHLVNFHNDKNCTLGLSYYNYDYIDEKKILLTNFYSNTIVIFDLDSEKHEIREINSKECHFSAVKILEKDIWLFTNNKLVFFRWDLEKNAYTKYFFPEGCQFVSGLNTFCSKKIVEYCGYIYCFPMTANMAVKISAKTGEAKEIAALKKYCQNPALYTKCSTFDGIIQIENKVYLQYQLGKILEYNMDTDEVKEFERKLSNSFMDRQQMENDTWDYFLSQIDNNKKA